MKLIGMIAAAILLAAPHAHAGNVGFVEVALPNGAEKPLIVGIWYPTDAPASPQPLSTFVQTVAPGGAVAGRGLPLIVMSHGTGGWYDEHYDVVAAVSHTDDTYLDQHKASQVWRRPAHIHLLIDYMLRQWPDHGRIDAGRVGMFGFSSGGFTTLVVAGGVPDLSLVPAHCAAHPDFFECQLVKKSGGFSAGVAHLPTSIWVHDARVKAAVVAAPGAGLQPSRPGSEATSVSRSSYGAPRTTTSCPIPITPRLCAWPCRSRLSSIWSPTPTISTAPDLRLATRFRPHRLSRTLRRRGRAFLRADPEVRSYAATVARALAGASAATPRWRV